VRERGVTVQNVLPDSIRKIPLFSGLTEQDKDALLKDGRIRRYSKDQYLFQHGDPLKHFYIVCSGTVRLFRSTADGNETTTDIVIAGRTMAKTDILHSSHAHMVNAVAVDDVTVMEFPVPWLKESIKKHHLMALNVLSAVSRYAYMLEVDAEHQASMSAGQIVACFLQRLCTLHGFDPNGFELPYSKTLIASRLGMELETFSRTLPKLRENGITVSGNHVVISDIAGMDAFVCDHCSVQEECPTHQTFAQLNLKKTKSGT
jgi:CRP-like cAMP-binding protein